MKAHKHLLLDQKKLDRARKYLGAKTESQAVQEALERVVEGAEAEAAIIKALDKVAGVGGLVDVNGINNLRRKRRV